MVENPSNISGSENAPKRFDSLAQFKKLENFPDTKPMVIVNIEGIITYCNKPFENTFFISESHNFLELNSEPELKVLIDGLSKTKYSSFHFELFLLDVKYKNPFYFVEVERIFVKENEFYVLIFSSLEERHKVENKINNLHNALEYGNVPVIITDVNGIILYATNSFEKILDASIEELYNRPILSMLSPFLEESDLEELEKNIESLKGCKKIISDINDDGSLWFKELAITPVVKDENGGINFIVTASDITNYIQKNRIIKRSEERQKSVINNISDLLLIIRCEKGNCFFENANDNFCEMFKVDRDNAISQKIDDVFEKPFHAKLSEAFHKLSYSSFHSQDFTYKEDTSQREFLGNITYIDDHYESERLFIVSLKDITEQIINEERLRRAYERETHINKLKSSFLANMSHEIRTPLNAIVGYSELIEDDIKNNSIESAIELFSYLKDGFNRLLTLVDNILEVSLIESGETEFDISNTKVSEVVQKVYNRMLHFANDKNIQFNILIEDEDIAIKSDDTKLEKIVLALVDNAIKYTDVKGNVQLETKFIDGLMRVIITDNGRGIRQDNLSRMLEPFSQEDEGHKREYEGAGLGLTIAYNLTKLMGGDFRVDSVKNGGTRIVLSFPPVFVPDQINL